MVASSLLVLLLAHGGIPVSNGIEARPGAPNELMVSTNVGALISIDDGATWDWVCEEAMAARPRLDPILIWTTRGHLLSGDFAGLSRSPDRGCSWVELDAFVDTGVSDLHRDPVNANTLWATTARFAATNGVFKSTDDADSFTRTTLFAEMEKYFTGVRVAPSDGQRVYASAWWYDPARSWLHRSDDAGATWTQVFESELGVGPLTVMAVSPLDPDVVFAMAIYENPVKFELWRSEDGGATFPFRQPIPERLREVSVSADGQTVFLTSAAGMYRSDDAGASFSKMTAPTFNGCIGSKPGVVLACGASNLDGWAAARSVDEGRTFTSLLEYQNVRNVMVCPADSSTTKQCPQYWESMKAAFEQFGSNPPVVDAGVTDAGEPVADAGVDPVDPPKSCGCNGAGGALLGLVMLLRRRRR